MKISYNWLKDYIDLSEPPEVLSDVLTQTGLEVEGLETVESIKGGLKGLVIGEVVECQKHPNADKLKVTKVDIGAEELSNIVCGGPNVAKGQKVVIAPVNTTIFPVSGEPFTIKKAKIRGEESAGMICAEDEIGLGTSHDGVIILETKLPNGTPLTELYDTGTDYVFEIGLTPNRGDAASHLGTARDLKAVFNRSIRLPEVKLPNSVIKNPIEVVVEDSKGCPRYSGVTIRGITIKPSPDWLQQRLRAIDLEPISNVVDITNFVLHSLGQPLHAFDADVVGKKVIVKTLPEGTAFTTLDEKERKLKATDLMICNETDGMCIAGVFGGIKSGVSDKTTSIFLESACFSADYVRATAMHHGLSTDASFRFERGTDPEITLFALQYATQLILELAGGTISSDFVDIYPKKAQPASIKTKFTTFDRLIGVKLDHQKITHILENLDIRCKDVNANGFTAMVAPYRTEVTREADLVEEVLRIYGINNVEIDATFSTGYLAEFEEIEPYKLQEEFSHYLAGKGFHEILTNSLTNPLHESKLGLGLGTQVEILNKSSEDLGILKPTPLYTGLEAIRYNLNRKQTSIRLFEFCRTYHKSAGNYFEREQLCLYLAGNVSEESWLGQELKGSIHALGGHAMDLLTKAGIDIETLDLQPLDDPAFAYGLGSGKLLKFGKLPVKITDHFGIKQEVFYAEMDWKKIVSKASLEKAYQPVSKYPEVRRDLSLVIDRGVSYAQIKKLALSLERKLLQRMNVFSVFEGEQLGKNKKAYAVSFYLQDEEKTLTDKHIDKIMSKLISRFETDLNALIRK